VCSSDLNVAVPMTILTPKTPPPYPAVLAFHGHGMGVNQILGHYPDDATRQRMTSEDENYAQRLAQDGFLVCAIEQQGFGERKTAVVNDTSENGNSCQHLATNYLARGYTLLGERVREGIAALHYLHTREDVLTDRMGCVGHSAGGTTALFLAALDERVHTTVISGYFCDFRASVLGMHHCICNYVPDLLQHMTIGAIAATVAPRRLQLLHGEHDPIFPYHGFHAPYAVTQQAYAVAGKPDNLTASLHPGGHRFVYPPARDWLMG